MVQLVATKLALMSHDLLRGKKSKKKILRIHSENFFHGVFFLLLQLQGDRTAWRSEVPKKLIDQEDECEARCRLDS
jgi:hypothetical protein